MGRESSWNRTEVDKLLMLSRVGRVPVGLGIGSLLLSSNRHLSEAIGARKSGQTYLVLGATGFTGKYVLRQLLEDPECEKVIVLSRRDLPPHPKQQTLVVKDFIDDIEQVKPGFVGVSTIMCCTGMPSGSAKSEAEYTRVEYEMPITVAKVVHSMSPKAHFVFCSGMGADEKSRFMFGKTKARTERDLTKIGFPRVSIVRPAGIMDSNGEQHRYWMYNITAKLSFLLPKSSKIEASDVAKTMILLSKHEGVLGVPDLDISTQSCMAPIYESENMKKLIQVHSN